MVLLCELNRDLLVANHKIIGFSHESTSGSLGGEELDDGEPLDGAIIRAVLVLIFRDIDVADGAMLLKDDLQFIEGDVTGQVAGDNGLHPFRIVEGLRARRENGRRRRSHDLLVAEVKAVQLRIDGGEVGRPVIRLEKLVHLSFLFRRCGGIIPLDIALEQIRNQRVLQGLHAENKVELLER